MKMQLLGAQCIHSRLSLGLSFITLACILFSFSGCDKASDPLPGERVSFLELKRCSMVDKEEEKTLFHLPQATSMTSWPQEGASANHQSINHLMHGKHQGFVLEDSISIGLGITDGRMPSFAIDDHHIAYGIDGGGFVYAIDLNTKQKIWTLNPYPQQSDVRVVGGGVAVDEKCVYATTALSEVLCLDKKTGNILWRQHLPAPTRSAPTLHEGKLYIITLNNELVALNTQDGKILWMHQGIPEVLALLKGNKPCIVHDTLIVPYSSGEVYALLKDNGSVLWSESLTPTSSINSSESISHITARPLADQHKAYVVSHGGQTAALDLQTGQKLWRQKIGGSESPILLDTWMFFINNENELICLNKETGRIRWLKEMNSMAPKDNQWYGPMMIDSHLVLVGSKGIILTLNAENGCLANHTSYVGTSVLDPVVVNKKLYILTNEGILHIFK